MWIEILIGALFFSCTEQIICNIEDIFELRTLVGPHTKSTWMAASEGQRILMGCVIHDSRPECNYFV